MKDMFAEFRNEKQEIDLLKAADDRYGMESLSGRAIIFLKEVQDICPIRSRQAAAMIMAQASQM